MGTQGVGTYKLNAFWESGRLIFYEKAYGHTTTGDVFILGHDYVQVGDTANDVDFQFYGTGSLSAIIDTGAATLTITGIATTITSTLGVTGIITSSGGITFADAKNIITNATTGTKIGTATTQKIGFWNVTPVIQPTAYTQTYATADKTHANLTATGIAQAVAGNPPNVDEDGIAAGGFITRAARIALVTTVTTMIAHSTEIDLDYEAILVDLADLKQLVNSVIDDLQAVGILS